MIEIVPFESAAGVEFGMPEDDVIRILGNPDVADYNFQQDKELFYKDIIVTLTNNEVVEISFMPTCKVFFRGIEIFSDRDAFTKICQIDGNPQESVGIIALLNIGLSMSGFHDGDESQKSISAFSAGRWDMIRPDLKPFDISTVEV